MSEKKEDQVETTGHHVTFDNFRAQVYLLFETLKNARGCPVKQHLDKNNDAGTEFVRVEQGHVIKNILFHLQATDPLQTRGWTQVD